MKNPFNDDHYSGNDDQIGDLKTLAHFHAELLDDAIASVEQGSALSKAWLRKAKGARKQFNRGTTE